MPNFETMSLNKIFEKERKDFIPEVGAQLEKETKAEIEVNGEKLNIDYRMISIKEKEGQGDKVVLLPGFGSGWEGISELGFSLAAEGRKVIMPSMPGYGNSSNPSEQYYATDNFENEMEAVKKFLDKLSESGEKFHLIGHSMGSEIFAALAEKYPEKVSSLVLLNPAGVREKDNAALLGTKFVLSGIKTAGEFAARMYFSGEKDYEAGLKKYIPKTQSPFTKERIPQRLAEAKKLATGHLLEKLKNIQVPITYISGELDTVFPVGEENNPNSQLGKIMQAVKINTHIEKSVMAGLQHNTTLAPDEITAANIEHYLEKAEAKNKD
jgi:pimeloyl-ACP methyl ester carboxylesterase